MKELYCFELYMDYTIVVELLGDYEDDRKYEGIAFIHHHNNPEYVMYGKTGLEVLEGLMDRINESLRINRRGNDNQ